MTTRALSRWTHLLAAPLTIECPHMQVIGHDHEPPLFEGSGQLNIRSNGSIKFVMHGRPRDSSEALQRLIEAKKNPNDVMYQFRVRATEYDGTEWNCGWTVISSPQEIGGVWRLSGPIQSLTTVDTRQPIPPESGIEVIYESELRIPLPITMSKSVHRGEHEVLRSSQRGGAQVAVAGNQIEFFLDPEEKFTWGVAKTSSSFPHPFAENWISEPLCLLLGQLVFPRLVARNLGGRSLINLRPSPPIEMMTLAASILQRDPLGTRDSFWELYSKILTMILRAGDRADTPSIEAHSLTRYYHEVIQASQGSSWAWCLAVASAIEGISKLITPLAPTTQSHGTQGISELRAMLNDWGGDSNLRKRIVGLLNQIEAEGQGKPISTAEFLRNLVEDGTIIEDHRKAWKELRNRVAHGELINPWNGAELERQMYFLTELLHRLSLKYIEECCK